jgi:integrase
LEQRRRRDGDKYFEADEVTKRLATAKEHFPAWHPFVLCGLRTGMRAGELLALQWGDLDTSKGFVLVQRAWVRGAYTTPKNGEERSVDLTDQLLASLKTWGAQQSEEWMARGLTRPDLVFPSEARTPHDDSKLRKVFASIVKKAGLRPRGLHAMRHTFVSLLLQRGVSLAYVQRQAGHKSMDLTLNVYGHFIPGGGRDDINRLDDRLAGAGRPNSRGRTRGTIVNATALSE